MLTKFQGLTSSFQITAAFPLNLTKQQILSQVNPMGLISLFTVRTKIMLRKLWALKVAVLDGMILFHKI